MQWERIVARANAIVSSSLFQRAVVGAILFSALLLGFETSPELRAQYGELFLTLDRIVLAFFIGEIALKILASGGNPLRYFRDGWNTLDFLIVLGCLVPAGSNALAVFRLVRVLRVLRLITAFPKLRLIVTALLKSIPSMGSVSVLLFIHFYTYAVLGVFLFGANDPLHFGGLGSSMLSLFTILTLEGWVDVMKIQMAGCAVAGPEELKALCLNSQAQPFTAVLFFLSFIVLGTMIILNLLIGVVVGSMSEAESAMREKEATEADGNGKQMEEILKELREIKAKLAQR